MNPSEKNKLYEKYMSGDITRTEMHRLNQYALEDDFLFDALEGAAGFEGGNAVALQELASKMEEKTRTVRRPYKLWMSIAAGIAIIVFAVTFLQLPSNEQISDVVTESDIEFADDSESSEDQKVETESASVAGAPSPEPAQTKSSESLELRAPRRESASPAHDSKTDDKEEMAQAIEIPAKQMKPVAEIAAIKTLEVTQGSEAISKDNFEAEMEHSRQEISEADATAESKLKDFAPANVSFSTADRAKKRAPAAIPFEVATPTHELQGIPFGADRLRLEMDVQVLNNPKVSSLLNEHLLRTFRPTTRSGEFIAEITIENNIVSGKIRVLQSINSEFDDHVIKEIETFTEWQGSGNQTIKISFN